MFPRRGKGLERFSFVLERELYDLSPISHTYFSSLKKKKRMKEMVGNEPSEHITLFFPNLLLIPDSAI